MQFSSSFMNVFSRLQFTLSLRMMDWSHFFKISARTISQLAQFFMNIPPVQNNVVSSAITVALGVTCLVFSIIEIGIDVAFPPVRHDVRQPRRDRTMQPPGGRINSISSTFPLTTAPTFTSTEMQIDGIELEDIRLGESPDEVV